MPINTEHVGCSMKRCNTCGTDKPTTEFYKNRAMKDGLGYTCKSCIKEYRSLNKDRLKTYGKEHYKKNRDTYLQQRREYYLANREQQLEYSKEYCANNLDKKAASNAKRRAALLQRIPKWLTDDDWFMIDEIYDLARLRSEITGVPHEVDHIYPLQGKDVSGLHCPQNLRVITEAENREKSNKYEIT
jgi:hypothetical protein